eukprot:8423612-Karenia_brevis.AAC.1
MVIWNCHIFDLTQEQRVRVQAHMTEDAIHADNNPVGYIVLCMGDWNNLPKNEVVHYVDPLKQ